MDLMEQLLCPQVCMDVEDTPIQIEADEPGESPEADWNTLPIELRARMILDNEIHFLPDQVPLPLLPSEQELVNEEFSEVEYLKGARLHCTVCNRHIGTSLVEQLGRYIHPELNTLMCQQCFKFYGTGAFEKDEDGSEIYCKWCGQGGTVMCCSDCPLVFCQNCVRRNLGIQGLNKIKQLDNWRCFKCNPEQLKKFHVVSHVLHVYTMKQLRSAVATRNMFLVKDDFSTCCKKRKRPKSFDDENDEFLPSKLPKQKIKAKKVASTASTDGKTPATGILHRALSTLNTDPPNTRDNLFRNLKLQSAMTVPNSNQSVLKFRVDPIGQATSDSSLPSLAELMPTIISTLAPSNSLVTTPPPLRVLPGIGTTRAVPEPTPPTQPKNVLRIGWLANSIGEMKMHAQSFIRIAEEVQARKMRTYRDLAKVHNQLQRALAVCSNKLTWSRQHMHEEFVTLLRKNNVLHSIQVPPAPAEAAAPQAKEPFARVQVDHDASTSSRVATVTDAIDLCDDDDDDVIVTAHDDNTGLRSGQDPLAISDDEADYDAVVTSSYIMKPPRPARNLVAENTPAADVGPVLDLTEDVPDVVAPVVSKATVSADRVALQTIIAENAKVPFDSAKMTRAEFMRAVGVRVILQAGIQLPGLNGLKANSNSSSLSRGNAADDSVCIESVVNAEAKRPPGRKPSFDFVREMQNEISQKLSAVRCSDTASTRDEDSSANSANKTDLIAKRSVDTVPGVDALEAIKQLSETIAETITESQMSREDIDSNDNVKTGKTEVPAEEQNVPNTVLLQEDTCAEVPIIQVQPPEGEEHKMQESLLNVSPPAISLEDMVKIYDSCNGTAIDGDMVPAD